MSFTLWFMGRPAAGKSTLAVQVENKLREMDIDVENLDGDEVRKNIHPNLGFTREERETNNRRTAYICKLLNRHDIPTIVAMITPFRDSQQQIKEMIEPEGEVALIYVKCSKEVCAERDPKGLYEQAEAGKIENFTGVNHPFQEPLDPDIIVDTEHNSIEDCVEEILRELDEVGIMQERLNPEYEFDITTAEEKQIKKELQDRGYLE